MTADDAARSHGWASPAKPHWWNDPAKQRVIRTAARGMAVAVPVVLVNAVAFSGQFGWLRDHLHWPVPGQIMVALALESVAVYLAFQAHLSQLSNDSSMRLRLGSYSFAAIIAAMNFSHYAPHWMPTPVAVIMGLMSLISPWLWSVHSRRASRDKLMERGLVEEHALRVGATRWLWHPVRSFFVMHRATWTGETDPARAIGAFAGRYEQPVAPRKRAIRPGTAEVAQLAQDERPAISAPGTVPPPVPPAVPAEPETEPAAHLSADATMPARGKRPPQEVISQVELQLAGTPAGELPGERAVARLLGDPNQRRLAKQLLEARLAAGPQLAAVPAGEAARAGQVRRPPRPNEPQTIATPASQRIGGQVG